MATLSTLLNGTPRKDPSIVYPEETLPLSKTIPLGIQHVLAMFGSTVLAPIIMGFDPSLAVFFSGIGTLLFILITRGKLPSYLGSSFAFIGPVLAAKANGGISGALFGILCAGIVYAVIALIVMRTGVGWIEALMPPIVTGAVVMVIGLGLAGVAQGNFMSNPPLAIITLASALLIAVYMRGFVSMLPILLGAAIGYIVAGITSQVNFQPVADAQWIGLPNFVTPTIDWQAAVLIAPIAIVLVAENTGHVKAISGNMKRNLMPNLGNGFLGDAVGTMLSALGGGTGQTTYAENIGVMAMTRVYSIAVFVTAAITAVLLGFCPKFAALIQSIPVGVMGGISFLLFGLIAITGARIWADGKVDFTQQKNLLVGGVTLIIGVASSTYFGWKFTISGVGDFDVSGIALATFAAIFLNFALSLGEARKQQSVVSADAQPASPAVGEGEPVSSSL